MWKNIVILAVLLLTGCIRHEYSLEDLSPHAEFHMGVSVPVVKGNLNISEVLGFRQSDFLQINGDSISLVVRQFPLMTILVSDLIKIPKQKTSDFFMFTPVDVDVTGYPVIAHPDLLWETYYPIEMDNGMYIDSFYLNDGYLFLNINNRFEHAVDLEITSVSLFDSKGNNYLHVEPLAPFEKRVVPVDLSKYRVVPTVNSQGETLVKVQFRPTFYNSGTNCIRASQGIDVLFFIDDLNDYRSVFGHMGRQSFSLDESVGMFEGIPLFSKISGYFEVSEPECKLLYHHSMGFDSNVDVTFESYRQNEPVSIIQPPSHTIYSSLNYLKPDFYGEWILNRHNTPGLEKLIAFPQADSVLVFVTMDTNPDESRLPFQNFILDSSKLELGIEVKIPLELKADLVFTDTVPNPLYKYEVEQNAELDYFRIHYLFENSLPLGADASIELFDSIANRIIEVIPLNAAVGQVFIKPALTSNGKSVASQTTNGFVQVTTPTANNILNKASHFILKTRVFTTDGASVRIEKSNGLKFKLGLDAKGKLSTELTFGNDD